MFQDLLKGDFFQARFNYKSLNVKLTNPLHI